MFRRINKINAFWFSNRHKVTDIIENYEKINQSQRRSSILNFAKLAVTQSSDGNHISKLGDITSFSALLELQQKMLCDKIGRTILKQKPRVNTESLQKYKLHELNENTFGAAYLRFMKNYEFQPELRPLVKYIPDLELAYIMQRYKQIHDFLHVLLGKGITIHDQLLVKWFEMIQLGLPSTTLAALGTPFLMGKQTLDFLGELMPIITKAHKMKFALNIYYEQNFTKDLNEFRKQLGI